jgi:hypothetical protein
MNYLRIYNNIIAQAKQRNSRKGSNLIVESHHILPRHCGGNNLKENKVNLTLREHFICHVLLAKIYKGTQFHAGMCRAVVAMNERGGVSSRLYQFIREHHIANLKKQVISNKQKQAISQANKGNKSRTGHKNSPEHIEILRQASLGRIPSDQTREIWSNQRKGKTPWNKGLTGGKNPDYPKNRKSRGPHSAESIEKMRVAKLEYHKLKNKGLINAG